MSCTAAAVITAVNACYDTTSALVSTGLSGPATELLEAANESLAALLFLPRGVELHEAKTFLTAAYCRLRQNHLDDEAELVKHELCTLKALGTLVT